MIIDVSKAKHLYLTKIIIAQYLPFFNSQTIPTSIFLQKNFIKLIAIR